MNNGAFHYKNQKYYFMKKNMGSIDQLIRFILGLIFLILYFTNTVQGTWGTILWIAGGVFLLTAAIRICPVYSIFNISTCPERKIKSMWK